MARQTTAITFLKNTSSHLLRVRLSQSHAEYRMRRWELSPQAQKPSPRGPPAAHPATTAIHFALALSEAHIQLLYLACKRGGSEGDH